MQNRRYTLPAYLALFLMVFCIGSASAESGGVLNVDGDGIAIKGYDAVAYFVSGEPVPGKADYSHDWGGGTWQFASATNRDAFAANPEKYAPQYGGYCAVGTSMGMKIDVDPTLFKIVDDKLYINSAPGAHEMWLKDVPGRIQSADQKWPEIKDKSPAELKG